MRHKPPSIKLNNKTKKHKNCRILVIEDDEHLRQLYSKALRLMGYDVHAAGTLQLAHSLLNVYNYDILLCDIQMDNNQLSIDLLRQESALLDRKGTRIIMVSCQVQYRATCQDMGIEFFLEKPVAIEPLITLVDRLATS